jgi:TatD DNase family protein
MNKQFKALIHSFSSGKDLAKAALDLGFYISLSGIVTFKNAKLLQEIVQYLPIDRILVETDSPYLAPGPFRGKQNTPAKVVYVAQQIADLKNLSYDFVVESTTNDFLHLFDNELRRNFLVINLLFFLIFVIYMVHSLCFMQVD